MKKIQLIFSLILLVLISSCGGGVNTDAYCDGDVLIPFQEKKGKDWGFINMEGEVIIEPEFENKPTFANNGLALVRKTKKDKMYYQFIRIEGNKAVEVGERWDMAGEFKEGLAPVRKENEKVSFINEDMEVVFTANAESVGYFNDGMAAFKTEKGKWGFLNTDGEVAIKAAYDRVNYGFSEGYAIVSNRKDGDRNYMVIDDGGNEVLNLKDKYDEVSSYSGGLLKVRKDGGYGFLDIEGNKVVKVNDDWGYVSDFFNGYATFEEDDEWGLIDTEGEIILKAKYENPLFVSDGLIWFGEEDDGKMEWGIMDVDGEEILGPEYKSKSRRNSPYPFMCGTSIVDDNGEFIFIDDEGEEINKNSYDVVARFDDKYISNAPWYGVFESDFFDTKSVNAVVNEKALKEKSASKLVKSLGINPLSIWGSYAYGKWDQDKNSNWRYYVSKSSYTHYAYKINYEDLYDDYDTEDEANVETAEPYMEEEAKAEDKLKEKFDATEPQDAPSGVSSVSYELSFNQLDIGDSDYYPTNMFAATSWMSLADAEAFDKASKTEKNTKVKIDKGVKIDDVKITIRLANKGSGKAVTVAKAMGKKYASYIKKGKKEESKKDTYKLSGFTSDGGEFIVRTRDDNTVVIELNRE